MGLNGRTTLVIPAMWEPHLADGSVEEIFNTEQDGGRLFKARLASDPSLEVFIKDAWGGARSVPELIHG